MLKFRNDMQTISDGFLKENQQLSIGWKSELDGMSANLQKAEKSLQSFEKELKNTEKKVASFDMKADFDKFFSQLKSELSAISNLQNEGVSSLKNQINYGFIDSGKQIKGIDVSKKIDELNQKTEVTARYIEKIDGELFSQVNEISESLKESHADIHFKINLIGFGVLGMVLALFAIVAYFYFR